VKSEPRWLPKAAILAVHEQLLAEHGGARGIRDEGLVDSALASPRHHFAYGETDVFELAAIYANAITRNHPFHDGNKRVALTAAGMFLELNGYQLTASEEEAAAAARALSDRGIDEKGFAEWLRAGSTGIDPPKRSKRDRVRRSRPAKA
jgi:death on curing protein